jgi:hypothetical protein
MPEPAQSQSGIASTATSFFEIATGALPGRFDPDHLMVLAAWTKMVVPGNIDIEEGWMDLPLFIGHIRHKYSTDIHRRRRKNNDRSLCRIPLALSRVGWPLGQAHQG